MTREIFTDSKFYRKECMKRQTYLRNILLRQDSFKEAIQLLLTQHATLHAHEMAGSEPWSYEDEIFNDLTDGQIRKIPANREHSIAWNIWYIARIEDVTMNMLVAGSAQIFNRSDWLGRMKISFQDTGNLMGEENIKSLSETIDIATLREYRLVVGRQTRKTIKQIKQDDLNQMVRRSRLDNIRQEGAVVKTASDLFDYWSRRNIAGLLLMPGTRHNLIHLNEAWRIKSMLH